MASTRGRQVVVPLTNKSGGAIIAGDVVVIDTANDTAFTTTTTGQAEITVGIAQESIASNATGRVLVAGYAALVNVPSSMTRGRYLETHTVVKQATGSATRRAGSFGQFLTAGTTPTAVLWGITDQTASGGSGVTHTYVGYNTAGGTLERMPSNRVYLKSVTLASAGFLASISANLVLEVAGVMPMNAAVFTDSAGSPSQVIALASGGAYMTIATTTVGFAPSTNRNWFHLPMGIYLTAGTYWIGVQTNDGTNAHPDIAYDGSGTDKYIASSGTYIGEGGGSVSTTTNKYSIRGSVLT